jgi:hypothetical protein
MQEAFEVLKDRPKIEVTLTRDSVAAGDDIDTPHEIVVEVYSFVDTEAFVNQFSTSYLPSVAGSGHSWTVELNGRPIALITENGIEPKAISVEFDQHNSLHFRYHSAR